MKILSEREYNELVSSIRVANAKLLEMSSTINRLKGELAIVEKERDALNNIITKQHLMTKTDLVNSVCSIEAKEHNKSIFHGGQCHNCYSSKTIEY